MKEMFFYNDTETDTGEFLNTLGDHYNAVAEDLVIIANFGPEAMGCERVAHNLWEYDRAIGGGRRVVLFFDFIDVLDAYMVFHGVRAGSKGATAISEQRSGAAKPALERYEMLREINDRQAANELQSLHDVLDQVDDREELVLRALKRGLALKLDREMKDQGLTKTAMAQRMGTSRAQLDRVLDPLSVNVTLETMSRAALSVGKRLRLELA